MPTDDISNDDTKTKDERANERAQIKEKIRELAERVHEHDHELNDLKQKLDSLEKNFRKKKK